MVELRARVFSFSHIFFIVSRRTRCQGTSHHTVSDKRNANALMFLQFILAKVVYFCSRGHAVDAGPRAEISRPVIECYENCYTLYK